MRIDLDAEEVQTSNTTIQECANQQIASTSSEVSTGFSPDEAVPPTTPVQTQSPQVEKDRQPNAIQQAEQAPSGEQDSPSAVYEPDRVGTPDDRANNENAIIGGKGMLNRQHL